MEKVHKTKEKIPQKQTEGCLMANACRVGWLGWESGGEAKEKQKEEKTAKIEGEGCI